MCISKKPRKFVDVLDVLSFRENLEILGDNGFLHVYLHGCAGCVLCATFAAPGAKGSNVRASCSLPRKFGSSLMNHLVVLVLKVM